MNDAAALPALRLPDDDRMLVTIHYYAPMQFTHQGALWLANAEQWVGTVWGTEDDRDAVSRNLTQAAAWARANRGAQLCASVLLSLQSLRFTRFTASDLER
jgi:endoglucanase